MSLKTWMESYYPKPADQTTEKEALDHSIRKWDGLQPEALAEHAVKRECDDFIVDANHDVFEVNSGTCALCYHFDNPEGEGCAGCPLYESRDQTRCDHQSEADIEADEPSPYTAFFDDGDPAPMLAELRRAKATASETPASCVRHDEVEPCEPCIAEADAREPEF